METQQTKKNNTFSLKNKEEWSNSRFAWFYAILIFLAVVVFAIILKVSGIYESMAWRIVNIFFILVGFVLLVNDYKNHKSYQVKYFQAWLLCVRAGFYFALIFLPLLLFVVYGSPTEEAIISKNELYGSQNAVFEIVFANYVETVGSILICSLVASYFVGFGRHSDQKQYK